MAEIYTKSKKKLSSFSGKKMACTGKVSTLADLPLHSAFLELFCPITSVVLLPPKVHSVEFMIIYLLTYNLILYIIIKIINL